MYENVYGKTQPPRFGENAVTLPLDVDRPCFFDSNVNVLDWFLFTLVNINCVPLAKFFIYFLLPPPPFFLSFSLSLFFFLRILSLFSFIFYFLFLFSSIFPASFNLRKFHMFMLCSLFLYVYIITLLWNHLCNLNFTVGMYIRALHFCKSMFFKYQWVLNN